MVGWLVGWFHVFDSISIWFEDSLYYKIQEIVLKFQNLDSDEKLKWVVQFSYCGKEITQKKISSVLFEFPKAYLKIKEKFN